MFVGSFRYTFRRDRRSRCQLLLLDSISQFETLRRCDRPHNKQNQLPPELKINRTRSSPNGDAEGISAKMTRQLYKMLSHDWLWTPTTLSRDSLIFVYRFTLFKIVRWKCEFKNLKLNRSFVFELARTVVPPPPAQWSCRIVYNLIFNLHLAAPMLNLLSTKWNVHNFCRFKSGEWI